MIGRNTCNSSPVDMRGIQLVDCTICRFCENGGFCACPPVQFRAISSAGQPNTVLLISASCPSLMRNCDPRMMGSTPKSDKRRDRNRSRDGEAVFQIGDQAGIATGEHDPLDRNRNRVVASQRIAGIFGNRVPSGLVSVIAPLSGRNATGETERISKPRISFSPPR